jgi:hypothetical protein
MLMDLKVRFRLPALPRWLMAGIGLLLLAYGGVCLVIGAGVGDVLKTARRGFPGNGMAALVAMVNSSSTPLKDRNKAVWALGQLGDPQALAPLEGLVTGSPCDHAATICQYELRKAIRQCRGGVNLTRWIWRRSVL